MQVRPNEPELAGSFRKDPHDERFLAAFNGALADFEDASYEELDEELPTLHVIGAPRSGTTLLHQVLASTLDLGYVNNLVAAFWRAPATGLRLARKLGLDRLDSSFASSFGRTGGVGEPHEFGYFWNHHLDYPDLVEQEPEHDDRIDWARLRRVIINMAAASGRSMIFKPMLLNWHLESMAAHMPRTCYVWIYRDRRSTALSLLKMRRQLLGDDSGWTSLKPSEPLDSEPPWRQVAAQVVLLERTIAAASERLGPDRVMALHYDELCRDPDEVVDATRALLGMQGPAPERRRGRLRPFVPQRNDALEREFGDRIDEALEFYEQRFEAPAPSEPLRLGT